MVILNSLPKSALAPLLIVWLGANMRTIIVAGMSVALFGSIMSLYAGFRETDPDMVKLVQTLGGGKGACLLKVVLPSSVPYLLSTFKVNIGLCLVGVVIGEFIGARKGLGYLIIYGSQVFKLNMVILSIVILCAIAAALYGLLGLLEKRYLRESEGNFPVHAAGTESLQIQGDIGELQVFQGLKNFSCLPGGPGNFFRLYLQPQDFPVEPGPHLAES